MEPTSRTTDRLRHHTTTVGELEVRLGPRLALWLEVPQTVRALYVVADEAHVLEGLLERVREDHDVRSGVERRQPQGVRHEQGGLAVVTGSLHAVVPVTVETLLPHLMVVAVVES